MWSPDDVYTKVALGLQLWPDCIAVCRQSCQHADDFDEKLAVSADKMTDDGQLIQPSCKP